MNTEYVSIYLYLFLKRSFNNILQFLVNKPLISLVKIYKCFILCFFFFLATPEACGDSQARDQTSATAVTPPDP